MFRNLAFDWWPGGLGWLLVFELFFLGVMALYRWVAIHLGRGDPTDFFVIFHRVFWRALLHPREYPIPVNYQPVPPRRDKSIVDMEVGDDLTEGELERLLRGEDSEEDDSPKDEAFDSGNQSELQVRVIGPVDVEEVRGFDKGVLTVAVTVAPDDGRANAIAMAMVARILRLESHQVSITTGHIRADKTLRLHGISPFELDNRRAALSGRKPSVDTEPVVGFLDD